MNTKLEQIMTRLPPGGTRRGATTATCAPAPTSSASAASPRRSRRGDLSARPPAGGRGGERSNRFAGTGGDHHRRGGRARLRAGLPLSRRGRLRGRLRQEPRRAWLGRRRGWAPCLAFGVDVTDGGGLGAGGLRSRRAQRAHRHPGQQRGRITGRTSLKSHEVDLPTWDRVTDVNAGLAHHLAGRAAAHARAGVRPGLCTWPDRGQGGQRGDAGLLDVQGGRDRQAKVQGKDYAETGVTVNAIARP